MNFLGGFLRLGGMVALVVGVIRLFKPSKQIEKQRAILVLVAGVFVFGIGAAIPYEEPTKQEQARVEQKQEKKEEKIDWATAEVTKDAVRTALNRKPSVNPVSVDGGFPKNITEIEIVELFEPEGQKKVVIRFKPESIWDETDFVKKVGGTAIVVGSILYKNNAVQDVVVFAQTEMADQYGKSELENVIKISLSRETADKVDWGGLAEKHVLNPGNIYQIADDRYIHPGILKNVKRDKVQL